MAKINILTRSEFGARGASRFDAEAFDEDVVLLEQELLAAGGSTLGALLAGRGVLTATRAITRASESFDYCSISSVDARDGMLFPETLPAALLPSRAKWLVEAGDILISQVRPERGAVGRIPESLDRPIASSGFFAVPVSTLDGGMRAALYFFLRGRLARQQLVRRNRNSMFPAVAAVDVASIVVPAFSEQVKNRAARQDAQIQALVTHWEEERSKLRALVDGLAGKIGSPPSPLTSRRRLDTTVIRRTQALGQESAQRIDAEFFRREYDDFDRKITELESVAVGDAFEVLSGARVQGEDLVPIFKQSALTNSGLNLSAVDLEEAKLGRGISVQAGDILIASTAHEIEYVGKKVDMVRDPPDGLVANQAVPELMILRPRDGTEEISSAFVVEFLRHEAGRHQFQRCIRGLRGGHTYPRDIAQYVKIPTPDSKWTKRFDAVAEACDKARAQLIDKTREAVQELEASIGQGNACEGIRAE